MAKAKASKDLEAVKERLLVKRGELEGQLVELAKSAEQTAEAEPSDEFGDSGAATLQRERDLQMSENVQEMLEKVEVALEKIDNGTYGVCESCGKKIEAARIKALPYATLCITCAQRDARRH